MGESGSEWTIATLKALSDEREVHRAELRELDREAVRVAVQTQREQRAEDKRAEELWRQTTNEARGQLKDQAATFITRETFDAALHNLVGDRYAGKTDIRGTVTMVVALVVLAISVYANFVAGG